MRSSFGVRARVRFRIHDVGTRQRAASSTASISSQLPFPLFLETKWTSGVSVFMFDHLSSEGSEFDRRRWAKALNS